MQLKLNYDIVINQSASRLWQILAHDFVHISDWSSGVIASHANENAAKLFADAPVGGRVCTVPGFGEIDERFIHFDTQNKSFAYRATASDMPNFVTEMENHWSVHELDADQCVVKSRAIVSLKNFPGFFVAPFMRLQFGRVANRFSKDLIHYAEAKQDITSDPAAVVAG